MKISKNTIIRVSMGTLCMIVAALWTISGIGRPLFASDLERLEEKIDGYQKITAVQILNIQKSALRSELRGAKRDERRDPDNGAADDVDEIEADIKDIDTKIKCYRTEGCRVESTV